MVQDARQRMKVYFETYLSDSALTRDDGHLASYILAFGHPDYPMIRVFKDKGVDLIFMIDNPTTTPLVSGDQVPYGYRELVPVTPSCIDKQQVTGPKLRWMATAELRRIGEENPVGSIRHNSVERPTQHRLGSHVLYQQTHVWEYVRDTT